MTSTCTATLDLFLLFLEALDWPLHLCYLFALCEFVKGIGEVMTNNVITEKKRERLSIIEK